jgi:hypothetical protein
MTGKNHTIAIEENDAILESSKQWLYRKCENHVTFPKNHVTFKFLRVFNFIQTNVHNIFKLAN